MADEIDEIGDAYGTCILTNLVTPNRILVTNLVTTKQQVTSILINLINQLCVYARRRRDHPDPRRLLVNVDDVVAEKIAAARARAEEAKRRRAALNAARQRGLAHRHAQKLRNLSVREPHGTAADNPSAANDTTEEDQ